MSAIFEIAKESLADGFVAQSNPATVDEGYLSDGEFPASKYIVSRTGTTAAAHRTRWRTRSVFPACASADSRGEDDRLAWRYPFVLRMGTSANGESPYARDSDSRATRVKTPVLKCPQRDPKPPKNEVGCFRIATRIGWKNPRKTGFLRELADAFKSRASAYSATRPWTGVW